MNEQLKNELHAVFADILQLDSEFGDDELFIELGGQSILMGELQNTINEKYNALIPFEKLFEFGTVEGICELIEEYHRNIVKGNSDVDFRLHPEERFSTHQMTDLQIAYYVGRSSDTELGGNPTRGYSEIVCRDYDHSKMGKAINRLFACHDILRCSFNEDGTWQVAPEFTYDDYSIEDISYMKEEEQNEYLLKKRERIFNSLFDVHRLPLVHFEATKCSDGRTVIHFSHDGMIIDGWSHEALIYDLDKYYQEPDGDYASPEVLFADYVRYLEQIKETEKYQEDRQYWLERMNQNFPKPSLPLKREPSSIHEVNTRQVVKYVDGQTWEAVQNFAYRNKLTPFSVIFTAFGNAILKYSSDRQFLINMPVSVRPAIHPDIDELLGECSNFFLFNFDGSEGSCLLENAWSNQQKTAEIMQHNYFMGTDFIRELQKKEGAVVAAPIVFTSIIDVPNRPKEKLEKVYTKTHTSQVWIDAIAMRNGDGIMLTMDCVDQLFEEAVTDGIGDTFVMLLNKIREDEDFWRGSERIGLTPSERACISDCIDNKSYTNLPMLSELFMKSYSENKDKAAVITSSAGYTHKQVYNMAACLSQKIGLQSEDGPVAVFMEKSCYQPISALACVMSGRAYYPIDLELPVEQVISCIKNAGASVIVTSRRQAEGLTGLTDCKVLVADETDYSGDYEIVFKETQADSITYIINTSGTTGKPKSIRLKQAGVVNCLLETTGYCGLNPGDRFLAITNYCHDMSVFDMLEPFICGGAVVIPDYDKEKDPFHWMELIRKYDVSFWNSVPALLEILLESDSYGGAEEFAKLRNVFLGGDRISTASVKKAHNLFRNAKISSCGGPSETTIWNIWHPVSEEDLDGTYIPYGKPIANTNYYILDNELKLCPPYKEGIMYVDGMGVADGYINLARETEEKFVDILGKRMYNTGDRGLYLKNGDIRILGRADRQVKINGKRIELEGISEAMNSLEGIVSGTVILDEKGTRLIAFYIGSRELDEKDITEGLKHKLPSYMIPVRYIRLEEMPLTKNGKLDVKALEDIASKTAAVSKQNGSGDVSGLEQELLEICRSVLGDPGITMEDTFFEMGGNSIYAITILTMIKKKYGVYLTIYDILNTPEIQSWSRLISEEMKKEGE